MPDPLGQCAKCGEWNLTRLAYCARCGAELPWAAMHRPRVPEPPPSAEELARLPWFERKLRGWRLLSPATVRCRFCDGKIDVQETVCPHCGQNLISPGRERWR